jgi:hypothetical protein
MVAVVVLIKMSINEGRDLEARWACSKVCAEIMADSVRSMKLWVAKRYERKAGFWFTV